MFREIKQGDLSDKSLTVIDTWQSFLKCISFRLSWTRFTPTVHKVKYIRRVKVLSSRHISYHMWVYVLHLNTFPKFIKKSFVFRALKPYTIT